MWVFDLFLHPSLSLGSVERPPQMEPHVSTGLWSQSTSPLAPSQAAATLCVLPNSLGN